MRFGKIILEKRCSAGLTVLVDAGSARYGGTARGLAGFVCKVLLAGGILGAASSSLAQDRAIPPDAQRGTMAPLSGMSVLLNGSPTQLAPGAVIRNRDNLIIVPSALPPASDVRYSTDARGQVSRVWVLTDAEKRQAVQPRSPVR